VSLLERDDSLATLTGLLAGIRSEGRLLLVGGEAGVGKTTLLRRFCEAADARVLWGACEPLRTPPPLGPFLDVAEATGGALAELVAGSPRPHDVAAALLDELRRRAPTVLVLEDLHWADEATLDVVSLLVPRIAAVPALVLATYRDDELDRAEQLRVLLGELVRRPGRLKLAPLSPAAVAELAAPHGADAEELHRRTGGNPFFVVEALEAGGERIPDTVRDAVIGRAARLPEPARRLLDAVAVVPGPVELWLLEALASELADRVDETSGMLVAGPAHVEFRHELARLAIDEAIAPHRRLALHRMALEALSTRGGGAEEARLAHHADAAGDRDAVLRWAPLAAERAAAAGAHREAAAQYARALRYADALAPRQRAELLSARAHECYTTADFEAAIAAEREALACHRQAGDRLGEGDSVRALSRLLFFAGLTDEGESLALDAVALLEALAPGHELAMAYGNVTQRRAVTEDIDDAQAWGARTLALADRLGDAEARLYALTSLGMAELQADRPEGAERLEQVLALAPEQGLEEFAGRAFSALVMCLLRHRRFEAARGPLDTGLAYCAEHGLETWRLYLVGWQAQMALERGHWDEAADGAAAVLRDRRSPPVARGAALLVLGLVRARRADADATAPLEEAYALAFPTRELMRIAPAAAARAEAAWLTGHDEAVDALTGAALALALEHGAPWETGALAYWRRQAGLRDDLDPAALAEPYRLALAGDAAGAAERWRELGCPYEAALARGDEASVGELQELGARAAARILARRLRERGVRGIPRGPHPRTRENPAGLTARELEVLALLAEGLRNAQIAERLVLSEKTVGHHVSAVLRKLDVGSRSEAATKALRLGLTG
jgi:DNA-binding NarL/FixJ family response regulator